MTILGILFRKKKEARQPLPPHLGSRLFIRAIRANLDEIKAVPLVALARNHPVLNCQTRPRATAAMEP